MTEIIVDTYRANVGNHISVVDKMTVDLNNIEELSEKIKKFDKIEVRKTDNHAKYYIHNNALEITKELLEKFQPDDLYETIKEEIVEPKHLTHDTLHRFSSQVRKELDKATAEKKALLFCKNGYFNMVDPSDKIFKKDKIVPLAAVLVL